MRVLGHLTMNGGAITGNQAYSGVACGGGGVLVAQGGSFTLNGGAVTGNSARSGSSIPAVGGGVYLMGNATINGGVITDNTVKGAASNLHLPQGKTFVAGETVLLGSQIGVSTETAPTAASPVTLTGGLIGRNLSCFFSDAGYALGIRNDRACLISLADFSPDFTLPAGLTGVEAEAFEGAAMTAVDIPADCLSIGDHAFRNCTGLTQIRIPAGCVLGEDVFDGCPLVYVRGTADSPAETWCLGHDNCVFVAE